MAIAVPTTITTEELTHCPICGAGNAQLILKQPDNYLPELRLHRCLQCQSVYLSPRLTLASMLAVENESEIYAFDRDEAEKWISGGLDGMMAYFEGYVGAERRRLLDIGCNRGMLMEAARRRGWQVTGVEIAAAAAVRARQDFGLTVYGAIDDAPQEDCFDLITAWHVLEHTHDPVAFLRSAGRRLAQDGLLIFETPSFEFLAEVRRLGRTHGLLCSVHNFYFTPANIQTIVARAALTIEELQSDPAAHVLRVLCRRPKTAKPWWRRIWRTDQ